MKKIRKLQVCKWSSLLLTAILLWTFGLHDLHHFGEDEQLACDKIDELYDMAIHCTGPCNDPSHHHHDDHSSPDHSDNCIVCLCGEVVFNTQRLIQSLPRCLRLSSTASENATYSSLHLSSASPRGPPVKIDSTI